MRFIPAHRARGRRALGAAVALCTVASVLGLAPAAHAEEIEIEIECNDVDGLITAILDANDTPDVNEVIVLDGEDEDGDDCDYDLVEPFETNHEEVVVEQFGGPTGLPTVFGPGTLTIEGNGATIERSDAPGTPEFRIMEIDDTGHLILEDLTVEGGRLTDFNDTVGAAGILNEGGILEGDHLRVTKNTIQVEGAGFPGGAFGVAGGILNFGGTVILEHSRVDHNRVGAGCETGTFCTINVAVAGGIASIPDEDTGSVAELTVADSRVDHNSAKSFGNFIVVAGGGGILNHPLSFDSSGAGPFTLTGSRVDHNTTAGFTERHPSPNAPPPIATLVGGGGVAVAADPDVDATALIEDSRLTHNSAIVGGEGLIDLVIGGGALQLDGDLSVLGTRMSRNRAEAVHTVGGFAQGGGFGQVDGTAVIVDSDFTRNVARAEEGTAEGGGLWVGNDVSMFDGEVTHNKAVGVIADGGGVYVPCGASFTFAGTVIDDNSPDDIFEEIDCF